MCGDYNIDLLKNKNKNINDYFEELVENGFLPKITLPTRIADHPPSSYMNMATC